MSYRIARTFARLRSLPRRPSILTVVLATAVSAASSSGVGLAQHKNATPGQPSGGRVIRRVSWESADVRQVQGEKPGTSEEIDAGQTQVMTLANAEQTALAMHPSLFEFQARVEAARGQWVQAGLLPNPILGYSGQQIASRGQAEQDGVLLQSDIIRGHKLRIGRAVAEQQILRAEQELAAQEFRVLTDVRTAYYDVLVGQRRLEVSRELVEVGRQGLKAAEDLFKNQEVSRLDVLQFKVEAEQAQVLLTAADNAYRASWRSLAAAMGRRELPARPLTGNLMEWPDENSWDDVLNRLLTTSPQLAAAAIEIERSRRAVDQARAAGVPNLTIQGIVQRDASIDGHDGALQVTMPIPIFNRNQGGVRAAEGELIAAQQAYQRLELDLQRRLAPVYQSYSTSLIQVRRYEQDILPAAEESLELTRTSYKSGEIGYVNLLTAQRTYAQINLAYIEAVQQLWKAIWEMEGLLLKSGE